MALLIVTGRANQTDWKNELVKLQPDLDVRIYPLDGNKAEIKFALAWNPPLGVFQQYPNLQCVASTGAGVDHILKDPDLPAGIKITRVVDAQLAADMSTYLVTQVMSHLRLIGLYARQQTQSTWRQHDYGTPETTTIGIMGMGALGKHAAGQ